MILYLDASALVKQYVHEPGGAQVAAALGSASSVGTALISRAEVVAALAKAVRMRVITADAGQSAVRAFQADWEMLARLPLTEAVVNVAADYAWQYGLRGHDAVHLASARAWADAMGAQVTFATFDRRLWEAASRAGLIAFPGSMMT